MILVILLVLAGFAGQASASSCFVVPGSIPAGSVPLAGVLERAAHAVAKPDDLGIAAFGLG